ncbi:hypothetical protein CYG49_01020 [Candidatus Saccharibacteria bacterium]|nr:MAG: hypothetical protein CYG49_01020 [Candidatus Saccharibacteria bacterium]
MLNDNIVVLMFISIIFIGALMLAIFAAGFAKPRRLNTAYYEERLQKIETLLQKDDNHAYQMVVINGDKLLDAALKEAGVRGNTMGERLKNANSRLKSANAVWAAHKLRNRIAHEDDVRLTQDQARRALNSFKAGLKDVGAL